MRLCSEKPNGEDRVTGYAEGLELRKRSRMLKVSSRRSGIRIGCCTSCSRNKIYLYWRRARRPLASASNVLHSAPSYTPSTSTSTSAND
ncbi:hypothetical protein E2C01_072000 [Portunus trituberculatus]|uniref:Uncharacterized protein n=1 Tax=Portunus trituberculatus TaxID=210409 RepID=A0A5B7I5D4_PORTR|nr:hypothetical protein [Portunus trituberculatus]